MTQIFRMVLAAATLTAAAIGWASDASAARRWPPLTRCGPDLAYLCPIRGYFDLPPYRYTLAIYPGCLQKQRVDTPHGVRLRLVVVCG